MALLIKSTKQPVFVFKHTGGTPVLRNVKGYREETIPETHSCVIRPYRDQYGIQRGEEMVVRKSNLYTPK